MNSPKRKGPDSSKMADYIVILAMILLLLSLPVSAYSIKQDANFTATDHFLQDIAFTIMAAIGVVFVVVYKMFVNLSAHELVACTLILVGAITGALGKYIGPPNAETFTNAASFLIGVGTGFYGGFGQGFKTTK
jgi:ribose/xylose/arabinose/galactoside ABC-type transport system permease subunit